mmetsp:Transcript_15087/g.33247  ORF Transcript_15087/g.33247 Transcript_15087/m.33247 type:complete len:306 (-) Transcript_15087:123-1040(-)
MVYKKERANLELECQYQHIPSIRELLLDLRQVGQKNPEVPQQSPLVPPFARPHVHRAHVPRVCDDVITEKHLVRLEFHPQIVQCPERVKREVMAHAGGDDQLFVHSDLDWLKSVVLAPVLSYRPLDILLKHCAVHKTDGGVILVFLVPEGGEPRHSLIIPGEMVDQRPLRIECCCVQRPCALAGPEAPVDHGDCPSAIRKDHVLNGLRVHGAVVHHVLLASGNILECHTGVVSIPWGEIKDPASEKILRVEHLVRSLRVNCEILHRILNLGLHHTSPTLRCETLLVHRLPHAAPQRSTRLLRQVA